MAEDLGLTDADAFIMELKSKLYTQAACAIKKSSKSHKEIAKEIGTSRARITRISNMGENSLSIELLMKIIVVLEKNLHLVLQLSPVGLEFLVNKPTHCKKFIPTVLYLLNVTFIEKINII